MCSGSGCGTVDSVVASYTRGPESESSHHQLLLNNYLLLTACTKDQNKDKEVEGMAHLKTSDFNNGLGLMVT